MNRLMSAAAVLAVLGGSVQVAHAAKSRLLTIYVTDGSGDPIPNAWVRIPETEGRRMVHSDGSWQADMLYTLTGEEMHFEKGLELNITVSAPGYESLTVVYTMRGRGNTITMPLTKMPKSHFADDDERELMIRWFRRTEFDETVEEVLRERGEEVRPDDEGREVPEGGSDGG